LGISSHPPGEFSLTSAGTKNPGQVKKRLSFSDESIASLVPRKLTDLIWPEALRHGEWVALVKPQGKSQIISIVIPMYLAECAFVWAVQNVSVFLACVVVLAAFNLLSDFVDYAHANNQLQTKDNHFGMDERTE
jgi:hypothetical protein